jgi:NADH-quinone oxidoreductase subunit K
MNVGPVHYAVLSGLVFALALYGVLARRNALQALVALVLLFSAPVIALFGLVQTGGGGSGSGPPLGGALAFFAIIAMASEAVVGLGTVLLIWRRTGTGDIDEYVEVEG